MKRIVKIVFVAILMLGVSNTVNAYNYKTDIAQNVSSKAKNNKLKDNLSWLDGNWRYKTTYYGITQEMRVGISGSTIVVLMNGEHYYTGNFSIDGNTLRYNSRNGSCDVLYIDKANKCLMVDEYNRMERF